MKISQRVSELLRGHIFVTDRLSSYEVISLIFF